MTEIISGFVIPKPDDFHVHLRHGELLRRVLPDTARDFGRALVMPNLPEPVWDAVSLVAYRAEILDAAPRGFEPLMTIYLTDRTTPEIILEAGRAGAVAAKFYPKHGTTQSSYGLTPHQLFEHDDWFAALSEAGMVLCLHGEDPRMPMLDREDAFLEAFVESDLPNRFPKLRFVIEHGSTASAVEVVKSFANVALTITVHHMILTTDDVIGDHDCLCMPVAKSADDRFALIEAASSGHPRIFFGSDSAPHVRLSKNRARGSFGTYTAPVALPLLAQVFAQHKRFQALAPFVSRFGAEWYRLPEAKGKVQIEIHRNAWSVPDPTAQSHSSEVVRPFYAGRSLHWSVRHE